MAPHLPAQEERREVGIELQRDKNERIRKRGERQGGRKFSKCRGGDGVQIGGVFLYRADFNPV
jgi:hypothetical protein